MTGDLGYESRNLELITLLEHVMKKFSIIDPVISENSTGLLLNSVDIYTII